MKLHFKPMPGLTIVTAIGLVILISLGTWQYQRLQWKTGLLAEIEAAATAPPFTSLSQIQAVLDAGEPVDFRRVGINVVTEPMKTPFHVFQATKEGTFWRPYFTVQESGIRVFMAWLPIIPDSRKDLPIALPSGQFDFSGYVRLARPTGWFATKSTPDKNRWFEFNPMPEIHDWADQIRGDVDTRFYIDLVDTADKALMLPIKRPDIRNNHLDYMLTWYSFAIILLVIYFILHVRAGRLGYKHGQ